MKFELNPYNYGLSDNELLDDLRAVSQLLCKNSIMNRTMTNMVASALQLFKKDSVRWEKHLTWLVLGEHDMTKLYGQTTLQMSVV